jgi:hypothetical protein
MRHVLSLIAGVVAALLAWLLLATGQLRWLTTVDDWETAGTYFTAELIGPGIVLAVVGVLLGVLGTLRWSPAGPVAAGVLLTAPAVVMFVNPFQISEWVADEWRLFGQDLAPLLPVRNGTLLVLGVLLLMAVFSTQRWRRWPSTDAQETGPDADAAAEPDADAADASADAGDAPTGSTAEDSAESVPAAATATTGTGTADGESTQAAPAGGSGKPSPKPKQPKPRAGSDDGG